jgi:DNA-binding LacI/PurR family transcriptional regulator
MGKKFKNKDLAARLGVSGTLVSLVLNNKGDQHGIKKDTQEKVFALARQMGYFTLLKEKGVSSPVEDKPGIIGMIVPSVDDPMVTGITSYIQKAFASIGTGFSIITRDTDDQRFDRLITSFRKFFSGLILVGDVADDPTIRVLRTADYPFVLLENNCKNLRLNSVCSDNIAGARIVCSHIRGLGYKNVVIAVDSKSKRSSVPLLAEIENELSADRTNSKPVIVEMLRLTGENEYESGQLERYLRPPFRADIIITLNASLVYPVLSLLRKKKIRVPQDIALISMEEGAGFDLISPSVTCLRKPLPGLAIKTANMIWSEIKNNGKGKFKRQVSLTPELMIRDSCGHQS